MVKKITKAQQIQILSNVPETPTSPPSQSTEPTLTEQPISSDPHMPTPISADANLGNYVLYCSFFEEFEN